MMTDNVTNLHNPEAGVVSFGVRIAGYTAVVDGREIPRLMVYERSDQITITLDRRFEIDVPREHSGSVCWMIANALAIGEGYSHCGAESKSLPFAPQVQGPHGKPDISGGGPWPKAPQEQSHD
ncbi:MAG: hypothetical protein Unbinned3138contig1000_57 [Prokaryotic dsDNA virus sp.]|nr:MAG: hypothetical protein Unbinned3138contig1000_57 [Prokaryotic dsDNA virus sp.]|tara:strand:- start:20007 stop:20375 length:369 start_codon:yes stop_codon:yes gene_type:complete